MRLAIEAVRNKAMSKRKAAMMFGVPRSTLLDKLSGRGLEARTRPGPATVVSSKNALL
ncbi:hypothetical protein DPMN_141371 [Dreissena polymorpha]|uniref:HTH psq-type domain-containing protein n=1 Tax=Dreissena polymorpha TaxID=45954 RepID=A0A9D4JL75_DREPO|nr:hypothetical protein DPMN_141371 [Dreissena polymorpha]